jgi:hypothetical protein
MREYDCGDVLNYGKFIVREYDYYLNELVFYNYNIREVMKIKEGDNLQELIELGWWLFERVDEGMSLDELLRDMLGDEVK